MTVAAPQAPPVPEPVAPPVPTQSAEERLAQYIHAELMAKLESARASGGMQGERRIVRYFET